MTALSWFLVGAGFVLLAIVFYIAWLGFKHRGTTLAVSNTEDFPDTGHIVVTHADGTQETLRYTGKTGTSITYTRPVSLPEEPPTQ